ncbi:MAG: aldehyde dehydrogenase family protein, partial [Planctomycetales bacterium]|nr:aldehyde dehydrogenase family protein [Planctomycetales bacterium]
VSDPRIGATGYTGSRSAGLKLKAAADAAGKPIYVELSSVNPVVILPGALDERIDDIVGEFKISGLMGTGQFCTNPGVVMLLAGDQTESFIEKSVAQYVDAAPGTLLSEGVQKALGNAVAELKSHGATSLVGDGAFADNGFSCANTLLRVSGEQFLSNPVGFQEEAFGNCSMFVVADSVDQLTQIIDQLEGNLTGCIYSHTQGNDDEAAAQIGNHLRPKVGRLLNDKMPTGVAVSPAMNHGGPYPATGHPGFTAVGIPGSIPRFAALHCYDAVRAHRLPPCLQDKNPNGEMWRSIDGKWTQGDV